MTRPRRRRALSASFAAALAAAAAVALGVFASGSSGMVAGRPEHHPQLVWVACNRNAANGGPSTFTPLSDAAAAALVTPERETRPYNAKRYTLNGQVHAATNDYVPTTAQLAAFLHSKTSLGQTVTQLNPYLRFVDGRDGMRRPSTDDLIQWAAHKWGIPENWLRAQYVEESYWNSFMLGDDTPVTGAYYPSYPSQARAAGRLNVYQSMGIAQVRWNPDGSVDPGNEPLRWESTAFNIDFQAAMVRFYYDNPRGSRTAWGDSSYKPCEQWASIGGWNSPYPWNNAEQQHYIDEVRQWLHDRQWKTRSFVNWSPSSFPPGISFP
jgi:hypothetical protein